MFWKMFAVLCLISASVFAFSYLRLAQVTSVIPTRFFVERSNDGKLYRYCSHQSVYDRIECDEWAKAHTR
jgi:hypothetical protein